MRQIYRRHRRTRVGACRACRGARDRCGRFLRRLEEESYAFLIRPRRFGKSLWVSVLENYHDRTRADEWHAVFDGTDIGRQPTEDRSRYVILRFNFSAFDDTLETLRERFEAYCEMVIRRALERNVDLFPDAAVRRILAPPATEGRLGELFTYAGGRGGLDDAEEQRRVANGDRGIPLYFSAFGRLGELFTYVGDRGIPLYGRSTSTTISPTRCWRTTGGRRTNRSRTAAASTATSSPR